MIAKNCGGLNLNVKYLIRQIWNPCVQINSTLKKTKSNLMDKSKDDCRDTSQRI
jgi:hypothetical protein